MTELHPLEALLPSRIELAIQSLPYLALDDLKEATQDCCPICLVPFTNILAGSRAEAITDLDDSGALSEKDANSGGKAPMPIDTGVTRLMDCGHMFCRKDLAQWMRRLKGSCPTCRHVFLDLRPYTLRRPHYDARPVRVTRRWSRSRLYFNDIEIGTEVEVADDSDSDMGDEWDPVVSDYDSDELYSPLDDVSGDDDDIGVSMDDDQQTNATDDRWVDAQDIQFLETVRPITSAHQTSPLHSSPLRSSWLPSQ